MNIKYITKHISELTSSEIEVLKTLCYPSFQELINDHTIFNKEAGFLKVLLNNLPTHNNEIVYLAYDGLIIVGWAIYSPNCKFSLGNFDHVGSIFFDYNFCIFIKEQYRNKNIGNNLIDLVLKKYKIKISYNKAVDGQDCFATRLKNKYPDSIELINYGSSTIKIAILIKFLYTNYGYPLSQKEIDTVPNIAFSSGKFVSIDEADLFLFKVLNEKLTELEINLLIENL